MSLLKERKSWKTEGGEALVEFSGPTTAEPVSMPEVVLGKLSGFEFLSIFSEI